jgi:hypothetical protein
MELVDTGNIAREQDVCGAFFMTAYCIGPIRKTPTDQQNRGVPLAGANDHLTVIDINDWHAEKQTAYDGIASTRLRYLAAASGCSLVNRTPDVTHIRLYTSTWTLECSAALPAFPPPHSDDSGRFSHHKMIGVHVIALSAFSIRHENGCFGRYW